MTRIGDYPCEMRMHRRLDDTTVEDPFHRGARGGREDIILLASFVEDLRSLA